MNLLQPVQCIVYIWPGTCGISSKEGNIPNCDAGTTRLLILLFFSIGSYIYNCKVFRYQNKCIKIPCYSITENNYHQGHKDTSALRVTTLKIAGRRNRSAHILERLILSKSKILGIFIEDHLPPQNTDNCKKINVQVSYKCSISYK